MSNIKSAVLQVKVEGILTDLMLRTNTENVMLPDGTTLAAALAGYFTAAEVTQQIDSRVNAIVNGAPEAFDTLKEVAEYIAQHEDVYDALNAAVGNKVDKIDGKGLSEQDFTAELKAKLEGLTNYTHPTSHSADMITETADKNFVTAAEKAKIAASGRILTGESAPGDMTGGDIFLQIIG